MTFPARASFRLVVVWASHMIVDHCRGAVYTLGSLAAMGFIPFDLQVHLN